MRIRIQVNRVGNVGLLAHDLLHHRMTTTVNGQFSLICEAWTNQMLLLCHNCKGLQNIDGCNGPSQLLQATDILLNLLANPHENLVLQISRLITRLQHLPFDLSQLFRSIPLRILQGRLTEEMTRHIAQIGIGHMEIVTVFFIVINLKIVDTRRFTLLGLNLRNPTRSLTHDQAVLIQRFVKARTDDVSICDGPLGFWVNSRADESMQFWNWVQSSYQIA